MKTTIELCGALLGAALLMASPAPVQAQAANAQFKSSSFLADNVQSLTVSNLVSFTNLASPGVYGSNSVGLIFTNSSSTRVIVVAGVSETRKLTKDVDLYPNVNGTAFEKVFASAVTNQLELMQNANANITIKLVGGSGANVATAFTVVPLLDGVNESTAAGDWFVFAVTPNTTTAVCVMTNLPTYRWPGVSRIRLKTVLAGDTDASSSVTILAASVNQPVH